MQLAAVLYDAETDKVQHQQVVSDAFCPSATASAEAQSLSHARVRAAFELQKLLMDLPSRNASER